MGMTARNNPDRIRTMHAEHSPDVEVSSLLFAAAMIGGLPRVRYTKHQQGRQRQLSNTLIVLYPLQRHSILGRRTQRYTGGEKTLKIKPSTFICALVNFMVVGKKCTWTK